MYHSSLCADVKAAKVHSSIPPFFFFCFEGGEGIGDFPKTVIS